MDHDGDCTLDENWERIRASSSCHRLLCYSADALLSVSVSDAQSLLLRDVQDEIASAEPSPTSSAGIEQDTAWHER